LVEVIVFLKSHENALISNPTERLHGAVVKLLARRLNIEEIHGPERARFCLSPIYDVSLNMVRRFEKNKKYLFRLASTNRKIRDSLLLQLAIDPIVVLENTAFEVCEVLSEELYNIEEPATDTLYFISPTTFKVSKTEHLPLPEPTRIAKSLSKILNCEIVLPAIEDMCVRTKAISFSHHVLIGFVGYLKFNEPLRELAYLHFTGLGYSTARGFGSVLVRGVHPNEKRIKELHEKFSILEKKRCGN